LLIFLNTILNLLGEFSAKVDREDICKLTISDEVIECFQFTYFFQLYHGPEVYSTSNGNEYQKVFLGVKCG
jgi:hypothetical protein